MLGEHIFLDKSGQKPVDTIGRVRKNSGEKRQAY